MTTAIAFVLKPGRPAERDALLLAASVRQFVQVPVTVQAWLSPGDAAHMTPALRESLAQLDVTLHTLPDTAPFRPPYPRGEKIRLASETFEADRVLLMTPNRVFLQPTDLTPLTHADLVLTPADPPAWGSPADWAAIRALWDAAPPEETAIPAQYDPGLVSFTPASGFAAAWRAAADRIDTARMITGKRPRLDQIALAASPLAGGPAIALPATAGLNARPTRRTAATLTLARYAAHELHLSGLGQQADHILEAQLGTSLRDLDHARIAHDARRAARQLPRGKAPFVKIYGERNTATNFLQQTVAENFDTTLLASSNDAPEAVAPVRRALRRGGRRSDLAPQDVSDALILRTGLGWKHGAPPLDLIETSPYRGHTLFLCIHKDPYFWLKSMYRRPYNPMGLFKDAGSLSEFIRRPLGLSARDRLTPLFDLTPLEVYQRKLRAYLDLQDRHPGDVLIVPYEETLRREDTFLDCLAHKLEPRRRPLRFPGSAAKRLDAGSLSTADYLSKYDDSKKVEGFTEQDLAFIERQIDPALMAALGRRSVFAPTPPVQRLRRGIRARLAALR